MLTGLVKDAGRTGIVEKTGLTYINATRLALVDDAAIDVDLPSFEALFDEHHSLGWLRRDKLKSALAHHLLCLVDAVDGEDLHSGVGVVVAKHDLMGVDEDQLTRPALLALGLNDLVAHFDADEPLLHVAVGDPGHD